MQSLVSLHTSMTQLGLTGTLVALGLAFILSSLIAWTYVKTFQGLSYSKAYLQSLILASIVVSFVMMAIGDSLARGLGMMGALAMVRFRSSVKDPRDMMFVFASLAVGIACGVHSPAVAVIGTIGFCLVALILYRSPFSQRSHYDGLLRFHMENQSEARLKLESALSAHCQHFALITLRDIAQGTALDYAYQVKIRTDKNQADFVDDLRKIPSVRGLSLLLQETTVEV